MAMTMMNVGKVRVRVRHRLVNVRMRMRLARVNAFGVIMLMMFVMDVPMRVFQQSVMMRVRVALGQVEPHAARHESGSGPERALQRFAQKRQRHQRADKRSQREIRACPRRSDKPQSQHETREAQAIAKEADDKRAQEYSRWRRGCAEGKSNREIDDSRDQTFDGRDLKRVAGRDFLRQVVVHAPASARRDDKQSPC